MSQHSDGDVCSVYEASARKAKKEHRCGACGEKINPGDVYTYVFLVWQRERYVYKRCMRCETIFQYLEKKIRVDGDDEEFCDAELSCDHSYQERWKEPPPAALEALAFWRQGDPLPSLDAPKKKVVVQEPKKSWLVVDK